MKEGMTQWLARFSILIAVLGLAACSKSPTDESISEAIKAKYYSDPQLMNDRVEISTAKGEVTLKGEVSSDAARLQAIKLADETTGVRKVNDMMQVKPPAFAAVSEQPAEAPPEPSSPPTRPVETQRSRKPSPRSATSDSRTSEPPQSPVSAPAKALEAPSTPSPSPPPAPAARKVTVPAGTPIRIQMMDSVDSATNHVGEKFLASLQAPLVVNDEVIVPKGTDIYVRLTEARTAGKLSGQSELRLELDQLKFQGKSYTLNSSTYQQTGESRGKDTVKKTAIGAALGTAIGVIAGGRKGAAIGAGVGAGSGTAVQVLTKGKQVQVPSETKLDFELEQPVEISIMPGQNKRAHSQE